jgi:MHS family alpha-ketoglutarate permease-like MFS transporter
MTSIRSILGGSAGNLVEWFDWYVYSAFSLYFASEFFPGGDPAAQFIKTSGIFWAGFLMRPIGGWLLGRVADHRGRRTALALSVALMGGGSLLLAAIPSYATIGVAAPALLLVARLIQGLSLGGEYGAAAAYLSEVAAPKTRGLWSSFQYVTLYGGQLLALALLLLIQAGGASDAALAAWGWRVAFVASAALALIVFWIRRGIEETPTFAAENPAERRRGSIAELWEDHRRSVLIAFAFAMGSNVIFYTFTTYMQKYLVVSGGMGKSSASRICCAAIFLAMIAQPAVGALSDRIGRKPLQLAFGIGGLLFTTPLMLAIGAAHDPKVAFPLLVIGLAILSCSTATNAAVKSELFPVHLRALGIGLPYALSQSIFGGSAEALALSLKQAGHEAWYFYYASAMAGVALIGALFLRETAPRRVPASP